MKPWQRWSLFAASAPCFVVGMLAMYEAWWYDVAQPLARCGVFAVGGACFGIGMALIEGARED